MTQFKRIRADELFDGVQVVVNLLTVERHKIYNVKVGERYTTFAFDLNGIQIDNSLPNLSRVTVVDEIIVGESEALYLVCRGCGEAFRQEGEGFLVLVREHGASDPNTKSWCGDDGFDIMPESEAM